MIKSTVLLLALLFSVSAKTQKIPSWKITDVVDYYSRKSDSVYVINFWATFCGPCVAEIPFMQKVIKKYATKKVTLLLVSLDLPDAYPGKIRLFAKKRLFTADIAWLNETDADYFCNMIDRKWSGSIPATLIVNTATGYKKFYEQEFNRNEFERELLKALGEK